MKSRFTQLFQTKYSFLIIIGIVSICAMLPVLIYGVPWGYDLPHHYQCAMTFYESFLHGDFYPSWSLNRNFGFGGMESRLYPPLSHYSLAISYLIFGDWHLASFSVFTIYTFLGGIGVYFWSKEYFSNNQSIFAGCLYTILPYHLNQIYNTFFYAEFVGSCILPFGFLFVSRVCKKDKLTDIIGLAIAYALLILTHLPLTVIGSICFVIYSLVALRRNTLFIGIAKLGLGVLLGLAASSFFWTKVILEKTLMARTSIYEDPWLDYRLHFLLSPIQTFEGALRERIYETSTFFYDLMLLYTVIAVVATTVPFFFVEKQRRNRLPGVWVVFLTSFFLTLPFSKPIWDLLPFLQDIQFPWRWLAIVSISAPVLIASQLNLVFEWLTNTKRPFGLIISGFLIALVAFSISQIVRPAPYIEKNQVEKFMADNSKAIGFTFWWTIWTRKEIFDNKDRVTAIDRKVEIERWDATDRVFDITEGNAGQVRIATFYHPNWKATIDGVSTEVSADGNGAILIPVDKTPAKITLNFVEPSPVRSAQWLSMFTWIFLLMFVCKSFITGRLREIK